ncbi:MAG: amidohydrolase [Verrucomicrobia bacterium]|nr:amidohydrolase [Verrucomicrobiota bacterium]
MTPTQLLLRLLALILGWTCLQPQAATLLLKDATLHPVNHPIIERGDMLIIDERIAMVAQDINLPADQTIVLEGLHAYPGMIAMTTTLGLLEINSVRATLDTTEVGDWTPEVLSWRAVNPSSELLPVARANGITHAQPIPLGGKLSGQSGLIQLQGWTLEELLVKPTTGYHLFWPDATIRHTPKALLQDPSSWKSPEDQRKNHQKEVMAITEFFDAARAYAKAVDHDASPTRIPGWEAMSAWVEGELPLFVHANERRQIRSLLDWARSQSTRVILVGGRDAWMLADELAELKIPVIYEHTFTLPYQDTASYDVQFTAPSVLHRAGVQVTFSEGSDRFAASALRNLPYAAAQAMAFGLPREEAIKGITLYPAQLLGVADRLGSLEPGKEASIIITDGPLLDIRSKVTHMWIKGTASSLESRHTRLYETYSKRPRKEP